MSDLTIGRYAYDSGCRNPNLFIYLERSWIGIQGQINQSTVRLAIFIDFPEKIG